MTRAQREETEGLCNLESLEIFQTWYLFGGMQRGLSVDEVLSMPAWLRQDFVFITTYVSEERERLRREKKKTEKRHRTKGVRRR